MIQINHINIPLPPIMNDRLTILPTLIPLNIDTQSPKNLQLQRNLIIQDTSLSIISSIYTLQLQLL